MRPKKENSNNFDANKSKRQDPVDRYLKYLPVEKLFIRPLAQMIVRIVFNTPVTPNQLTYTSFFLGMFSGILFCFGEPPYFITAGIILLISLIFDCADGILARSKDICTHFGAYLDLFLDRLLDFFVFGGIVIGNFVYSQDLKLFIIGIFTLALVFLEMTIFYIIRNYKKRDYTGETGIAKSMIIFIIFVFSLINRLDILIIALLIGVCINISYKVLTFLSSNQKN